MLKPRDTSQRRQTRTTFFMSMENKVKIFNYYPLTFNINSNLRQIVPQILGILELWATIHNNKQPINFILPTHLYMDKVPKMSQDINLPKT